MTRRLTVRLFWLAAEAENDLVEGALSDRMCLEGYACEAEVSKEDAADDEVLLMLIVDEEVMVRILTSSSLTLCTGARGTVRK